MCYYMIYWERSIFVCQASHPEIPPSLLLSLSLSPSPSPSLAGCAILKIQPQPVRAAPTLFGAPGPLQCMDK